MANDLTGASLTQAIASDPDYKLIQKAISEGKVVEAEAEEKPAPKKKKEVVEDDDDEDTAAAKDDGDDDGETLEDELLSLAEETGVDPQLLEGCESVGEANRLIDRLFAVMHQQGQQQVQTNGHAPVTQSAEEKALELILDDYEENDPTAKNLRAILDELNGLKKSHKEIQTQQQWAAQEQANHARIEAENFVRSVLREKHPDLFGTDKKQSRQEQRRELQALNAAKTIAQGLQATGQRATLAAIAKKAVAMEFAGELNKKANIVKREQVVARAAKRTGSPAADKQSTDEPEVFTGPMDKDPALLKTIKKVRRGQLVD